MNIKRNKKAERSIYTKVKAWLQRMPRSEDAWHVSDLLYPRKTYWKKIDPKPMTDAEAGYFVAGRAHHGILEAILGKWDKEKHKNRADEGEFKKLGIYFSPDMRTPNPIEIKTSRSEYVPGESHSNQSLEKGFEAYLKQLAKYQALMNKGKGGLLVFYLGLREKRRKIPSFRFYDVKLLPKELKAELLNIKKLANLLTAAVKKKSHKKLPLCASWLCRDCLWFKACKPWLDDKKRKYAQK